MPALFSKLSAAEKEKILKELNYLNMAEYLGFCRRHDIPYVISVELADGKRKKTSDKDRKGVLLQRIRYYLKTGKILKETCYSKAVVNNTKLHNPKATDKLHYGQYDKKNKKMMGLLQKLTQGEFRSGSVAREVARDFWTKGKAPTFQEFARAWLKANKAEKSHDEWAFLTDLSNKTEMTDWKKKRNQIASSILQVINKGKI